MTPRVAHLTRLSALAAAVWIIYLMPWPFPLVEPLKPTLCAVGFSLLAYRLRVASWPLVVAFSLTFFVEGLWSRM